MLVSISEGFCLEGLLGAILFSELDMLAADVELIEECRLVVVKVRESHWNIELTVGLGGRKRGAIRWLLHHRQTRHAPTTANHCGTYHPITTISTCHWTCSVSWFVPVACGLEIKKSGASFGSTTNYKRYYYHASSPTSSPELPSTFCRLVWPSTKSHSR